MGRTSVVVLLAGALFTPACGSEAPQPDPIPADALPGSAAEAVELDATAVATDAIDFEALEALLDDAGFVSGTQRQFSGTEPGRRRVLARVLMFESAAGATRYVAWLQEHAEEVIGGGTLASGLDLPAAGFVFVHEPDPCCHGDTRIILAAWNDAEMVLTLEVGGQVARKGDVPDLASELDAAV